MDESKERLWNGFVLRTTFLPYIFENFFGSPGVHTASHLRACSDLRIDLTNMLCLLLHLYTVNVIF